MFTRQSRSAAAVCCVFALALTACEGAGTTGADEGPPVKGGTLNLLGAGDVDYMDPNISYYTNAEMNLRLWSRRLFGYPARKDQATTPVPDLATEVPTAGNGGVSKDGRTYTITLRDGGRWNTSPPRPVTAADVVRGVKRTCNPAAPSGGTPVFLKLIEGFAKFCEGFAKASPKPEAVARYLEETPVAGLTAKNDRTVVFSLTSPATYFVGVLTMPAFAPAPKELNRYLPGSADLAQHTVSNGPYQVRSYAPGKSIEYVRNPAWDPSSDPIRKAYVDRVVINETVNQESVQQQLEAGTAAADMEFDVRVPPSQVPALVARRDPNLNLGETSSTNTRVIYNHASPSNGGAMAKPEVRQALSYAINRNHIVQVLGGPNLNRPLSHVLPSNVLGSTQFDPYPHDPARARQLLASAGHGGGLTLKLLYRNASEGDSKAFQTIQQDLAAVGVTVKGIPAPNADFGTKYLFVPEVARRGVWDLSLAGWNASWFGDAALAFFKPLLYGRSSFPPDGSNFGLYDSAETNALIERAATAVDRDEAAALWAKADQQAMRDAAFYPTVQPKTANYRASHVKNAVYLPTLTNFDPANVWLEEGRHGG
ncbi:ABC transporter substrate-binding protein [Actinomadura luteofluorescens]|uniref:ABC transporter substrate-binding protein n=1 Tax=Actinomadura luteofluorescens TaxID=46163 RepID=UPI003D90F6D3